MAQRLKRPTPMQETQVWSLGREDTLEKEMATHSSILAWRIPWTEELGRVQSTGSQRVRHDWVTSLSLSPISIIFQWASLVAQMVENLPAMWETQVWSLGWEDPLEKGMAYSLQYSGLENSMHCIVHGVAKSQTWLSEFHSTQQSQDLLNLYKYVHFLLLFMAAYLCGCLYRFKVESDIIFL